ncbi:MAG: hypothetical protein EH225_00100 [Calditrichaeota bacterium]|nr:hypothetical protein [Calditrichota bacterium]RQW08654.1 MAG: hypothetical protein EH225_00100 [Calditrichota bacterium]
MDLTSLIVELISGAVGGNIAGSLLKKFSLGTLWNSIVGIIGGGLGGQLLGLLGAGGSAAGGVDVASIISSIAGGGVGGGILMVIIGYIKQMMKKSS